MRRLARHTLSALTVLSLVLCVTTLLGWASAALGDRVWLRFARHSLIVFGADGSYVAAANGFFFDPAPRQGDPTYEGPSGLLQLLRSGGMGTAKASVAGVEVYRDVSGAVSQFRAVVVPVAYPVALLAVLPVAWAVRARRSAERRGHGRCRQCGYDLTGNQSGTCPECGTKVASP